MESHMYWEKMVKDFIHKRYYTRLQQNTPNRHRPKIIKTYYLGSQHPNLYLTRREAECIFYMLAGDNNTTIACKLKLSPRTVEFYIKNMKIKLGCHTKYELMDIVKNSDVLQQIDFG